MFERKGRRIMKRRLMIAALVEASALALGACGGNENQEQVVLQEEVKKFLIFLKF